MLILEPIEIFLTVMFLNSHELKNDILSSWKWKMAMDSKILLDSPNVSFIFSLDNVTDNVTLQNKSKILQENLWYFELSYFLSPWDFLMTLDITA